MAKEIWKRAEAGDCLQEFGHTGEVGGAFVVRCLDRWTGIHFDVHLSLALVAEFRANSNSLERWLLHPIKLVPLHPLV
jgi:hypothetical protein